MVKYEIQRYSHKIEVFQNGEPVKDVPKPLMTIATNLPVGKGYIVEYFGGVTIKQVYDL